MKPINSTYKQIWQISLVSFILAALTGFLYRVGMLYPLPSFLDLINIRHAHSHLMFFNWISPPIMVWMASSLADRTELSINHKVYRNCLYLILFLGFLAYLFFLFYGYQTIAVGSSNLPVAAILSGFVMFTWYWFAWLYFKDRKKTKDTVPLSILDGALVALLICSLGAWGVSAFQFGGTHNPLFSSALTHFFLAVFTEGWAFLGILGIIWSHIPEIDLPFSSGWLWKPILIGSILIFPFSLMYSLITPLMLFSAKIGLLLIIISLSLNLYFFLSKNFNGLVWKLIFFLIGTKIVFLILAILPIDIWPGEQGIRILYLHLLLLGIFTITIFQSFRTKLHQRSVVFFSASVLLVLASLFLISGYAPLWMIPSKPYYWVMYIAFIPVVPASWFFIKSFQTD